MYLYVKLLVICWILFFVNLISCRFFSKKTMIIFVTLKLCMILFNFVDKLTIIDITYNLLFLTSKKIIHLINLFFYIKLLLYAIISKKYNC